METRYNFGDIEKKNLELWEKNKSDETNEKTFSLALPPPNATSILHIGHALNGTIHDMLARYYRMNGHTVSFIPGLDSAGISCQYVVTKALIKEGIHIDKMPREEFVKKIEEWVDKHGNRISDQLRKIGLSADWDKLRYTKDKEYDMLVKTSFVQMYNDGFIYRDKYLVNWCTKCNTTLSNDEVVNKNYRGRLYYLKYKLVPESADRYITIATTRPETIFGDTSIAFNPDDTRYTDLVGQMCYIPIINKQIPIISDRSIDINFGTGLMKVTPAHNKVDYELGKKHKLEMCNILDKYSKLINTGTKYDGKKLNLIKGEIIDDLTSLGVIEKIDNIDTLDKICYKCENSVENILSEQWFMNMHHFADEAVEIVDTLNFYPEFNKSIYLHWLKNIEPWAISRQICWAHEIPAWHCRICKYVNVSVESIEECKTCSSKELIKETDVLDTWFSSSLWAFGVFRTEEEYKRFFPLNVIISGSDILFFWITRMIMMSLYFKKSLPFKDIYLHGLIRDESNIKMSKTLGNVIDPLTVVDNMGADALRFGLMYNLVEGRDTKINLKKLEIGKVFCTKLWNSVRYLLTSRKLDKDIENIILDLTDDKICKFVDELKLVIEMLRSCITKYELSEYCKILYSFVWDRYCNGFLETTKTDDRESITNTLILITVQIIKMLHPIIPFITEELYQILKQTFPKLSILKDNIVATSMYDVI
jgi:valyl-tRNA synthetase